MTSASRGTRARCLVAGLLLLAAWSAGKAAATEWAARPAQPPIVGRVALDALVNTAVSAGKVGFWRRLIGQRERSERFRPYGVAWQAEDLLVTDPMAGGVYRIDHRGRTRPAARGLFDSPVGVAACNGLVLVTDSRAGEIALLDRELRPLGKLATGLVRPTGIACDGRVVAIVETGRHRILTANAPSGAPSDGQAQPSWRTFGRRGAAEGEFNFPTAVALDGDSVWVGDTLNFRLQRLRLATGEAVAAFGGLGDAAGEMPRTKGLAVDGQGRVWVSDALLDQVALFERDGTFLTALGGGGGEAGEFSFPAGLAAHGDGRIAVADSFNHRIQIFRGPAGEEAR